MQITFLPHAVLPRLVRYPWQRRSCWYTEQVWWNSNNRCIRRQRIYLLRTSIPSLPRAFKLKHLFNASIMLDDSAFRNFVGALCKLSSEIVSMQSGVDVSAGSGTEEGILDVEEDNIPTLSTSVTSLVTPL
jgi:hypothetical protein